MRRHLATGRVRLVVGDIQNEQVREGLAQQVDSLSAALDVLVNNASDLGASPLPALRDYPLAVLEEVFRVNTLAPLALIQRLLPYLVASRGTVVDVSSDAAVEAYQGWGGYGASKAALDQLSAVLALEEPALAVYAFDPGDMRTAMHQEAYPGRGHLRPARAGDCCPGAAVAAARPAAQWSLPGVRARRSGRDMTATAEERPAASPLLSPATSFVLPPNWPRASPPRRVASPGTAYACSWRQMATCSTRRFATWADTYAPATCSSSTAQRPCHQPSTAGRTPVAARSPSTSRPRPPTARRWWSSAGPGGSGPVIDASTGERVRLPGDATVALLAGYPDAGVDRGSRLWRARLSSGAASVSDYLHAYGRPISYGYLQGRWPLESYQSVFARDPGSAEMASAGRPFTQRPGDRPGDCRDRHCPRHAAHGCLLAGGPRTTHTRVVPRPACHRATCCLDPSCRQPCGRRRHDSDARP